MRDGMILGEDVVGVNQILPHKHKFAWDLFLNGCANNWMPTEISMQSDIKQWKGDEITDDEKLLVKSEEEYTSPIGRIFGSGADYIIVTENSIYVVSSDIENKRIS